MYKVHLWRGFPYELRISGHICTCTPFQKHMWQSPVHVHVHGIVDNLGAYISVSSPGGQCYVFHTRDLSRVVAPLVEDEYYKQTKFGLSVRKLWLREL